MKLCRSVVASDKSVHPNVCINVLRRLPTDNAGPQGGIFMTDMKNAYSCQTEIYVHSASTFFCAAQFPTVS